MNQLDIIVLSEAAVLAVIGFVLIAWLFWRRKRHQTIELERLLAEVTAAETERKSMLARHLTVERKVNATLAEELSRELFKAEKQFIQFFINYQFEQGSGAEFYAHLTDLLDQYLKLLPVGVPNVAAPATIIGNINQIKTEPIVTDILPGDAVKVKEKKSVISETDEQDWEAAFAETETDELDLEKIIRDI